VSTPFAAVNHVGFVVRDLDEGLRFFIDVLGFEAITDRRGTLAPDGDVMTRRFGINPGASGRFAFLRLGDATIELLGWSAPGQNTTPPLNSDVGGHHRFRYGGRRRTFALGAGGNGARAERRRLCLLRNPAGT